MTLGRESPSEMMGAATGFHCDDAGRELCGHGHDGFALHATTQSHFTRTVKSNQAAAILSQINAENRDVHGSLLRPNHPNQFSRRGGPSIRGEKKQAVGRSRGGRNTKIHALADAKGRLIAILLTAGEAHDCPVAERLIRRVKPPKRMLGDKAYDSAELREELHQRGTKPVIPNRCNRKQPFSFSKRLYKLRWRIESAFNRLKDFRRVATRYDRLARNYLASVCLAAALVWWI
jgi:transposase